MNSVRASLKEFYLYELDKYYNKKQMQEILVLFEEHEKFMNSVATDMAVIVPEYEPWPVTWYEICKEEND